MLTKITPKYCAGVDSLECISIDAKQVVLAECVIGNRSQAIVLRYVEFAQAAISPVDFMAFKSNT